MLFNSHEFLFVFLPATLFGFYLLARLSRQAAILWLILTSLVFYGWWRPLNILIIGPSIIVNYLLALFLLRLSQGGEQPRLSRAVLLAGILFNVAFLGFFKYTDFVYGAVNDVFGANLILLHVILPLGISFITFQKIAFLIDVQAGRVKDFTFREYCTFVLFFPQLIAGPIVHFREMMPQFAAATCRFDKENFAVGLTLLFFGLFKKGVLADRIAPLITPIYLHSAAGGKTPLLLAWMAAVGFTLQIYFDFSGYTDMALGLGRFFGITLPPNFNSPLKASSIIDFWLRWHMTLTRFLTAYIYNPMVLWLTRRRAVKGRPGFGGRNPSLGAFASLLMVPLIMTMFISGLWHGAGYGFIIWGLIHGAYLVVNHGWRVYAAHRWRDRAAYARVMKPLGFVLTFVSVTTAMVFFRAATVRSAVDLVKGVFGVNGVALHDTAAIAATYGTDIKQAAMWVAILLFIALVCPNTLEILAPYEPALGWKPQSTAPVLGRFRIQAWGPSLPWAVAISVVAAVAIFSTGGPSEFLYWQF
ncbi:MAG TPA: MBOAT family O-acyltransferase [Roseiarcus sp.]|jgi:D-alanyl-lipoteichoic acid acyltransferase DltB (MBOAT superfamily)